MSLSLTLKRMAVEEEENTVEVLQEAIEALAHAAEAREVGNADTGR